jgi:hypothetical protein
LVLLVCSAAYAENYTYKRTKADDATARSLILRTADLPAQLRLAGGSVKPDETPDTEACNGYRPKERDLVVAGDAESRFHNAERSVVVDSQVQLFRSTAMAATDVQRSVRMLTPACQAQAAKQDKVKLVHYALLGRPRCTCDFAVSMTFETKTAQANLDELTIVTAIRKGRLESSVVTNVGKVNNDPQKAQAAAQTAVIVQGLALKAALVRLHAA